MSLRSIGWSFTSQLLSERTKLLTSRFVGHKSLFLTVESGIMSELPWPVPLKREKKFSERELKCLYSSTKQIRMETLLMLFLLTVSEATHFRGGIISWEPVMNQTNEVTQVTEKAREFQAMRKVNREILSQKSFPRLFFLFFGENTFCAWHIYIICRSTLYFGFVDSWLQCFLYFSLRDLRIVIDKCSSKSPAQEGHQIYNQFCFLKRGRPVLSKQEEKWRQSCEGSKGTFNYSNMLRLATSHALVNRSCIPL